MIFVSKSQRRAFRWPNNLCARLYTASVCVHDCILPQFVCTTVYCLSLCARLYTASVCVHDCILPQFVCTTVYCLSLCARLYTASVFPPENKKLEILEEELLIIIQRVIPYFNPRFNSAIRDNNTKSNTSIPDSTALYVIIIQRVIPYFNPRFNSAIRDNNTKSNTLLQSQIQQRYT